MKLRLFIASLFIFSFCASVFARVPLDQCFDLYEKTKDDMKDLSPVWAEIMLQSGQLKNIRFFGNISSEKNDQFQPHPAFEGSRLVGNAPQDPIIAVLQYLFPSTNGNDFTINQRKNDPIGKLSKKEHLGLVNELIRIAITGTFETKEQAALKKEISDILKKLPKEKSVKTRKKFNETSDCFVNIFSQAVLFQNTEEYKKYYPEDILIHSLFAFALTSASNIDDIYHHFDWIFKKGKLPSDSADCPDSLNSEDDAIKTKELINALFRMELEKTAPTPLTFYQAVYTHDGKNIPYPNCGEISLLNFFYYVWGTKGIINQAFIDETEEKFTLNHVHPATHEKWRELKTYFKEFPSISSSLGQDARVKWSQLISNLNRCDTDPSLQVTYREGVCNTQGIGIINMLNVLEKIIPEETLTQIFENEESAQFELVGRKLDKICQLFSRDTFALDWNVEKNKVIDKLFVFVNFTNNGQPFFMWQFKEGSFGFREENKISRSLFKDFSVDEAPSILKIYYRSLNQDNSANTPAELFGFNLLSVEGAFNAIREIFANDWGADMRPTLIRLIEKTLSLDPSETMYLFCAWIGDDEGWYRKLYDPNFLFSLLLDKVFTKNIENNLLNCLLSSPYNMKNSLILCAENGFTFYDNEICNMDMAHPDNIDWLVSYLESSDVESVFSENAMIKFIQFLSDQDFTKLISLYETNRLHCKKDPGFRVHKEVLQIAAQAGALNFVKLFVERGYVEYDRVDALGDPFFAPALLSRNPALIEYLKNKGFKLY